MPILIKLILTSLRVALPVVGVSLLSALGGWLSAKQGGGRNRMFRYLGFALVLASQLPQPARGAVMNSLQKLILMRSMMKR